MEPRPWGVGEHVQNIGSFLTGEGWIFKGFKDFILFPVFLPLGFNFFERVFAHKRDNIRKGGIGLRVFVLNSFFGRQVFYRWMMAPFKTGSRPVLKIRAKALVRGFPENWISRSGKNPWRFATSERFCNMNLHQVVPILAQEGEYPGSESTIYRVLRKADMIHPRNNTKPVRNVLSVITREKSERSESVWGT